MFPSWFDDSQSLWPRARKYSSKLPKDYNAKRFTESLPFHHQASQPSQLSFYRPQESSLIPRTGFFDDFWKNVEKGKYFIGFDEDLQTVEEDDRYLVSFERENLSTDDVNIDFNKAENELIISVDQYEKDRFGRSSSSKYHSAMKFTKPIDIDKIKADVTDTGIDLILPKERSDSEDIYHVPLKGIEGTKKSST